MLTPIPIALWLSIPALLAGWIAAPEGARPPLRIASDATFPPFHFIDAAGSATGFDIELARLVAQRSGFEAIVVVRPYDQLFDGLVAGEHDVVAATTGITPERERQYLLTRPYFETCQAALVRLGPAEPATVAELRGRRVGAAGAGTSARALLALENVEQVRLGAEQQGVPTLEQGKIDALVLDEFAAVRAARSSGGRLRVLEQPLAPESYAFVLARGRDDLLHKLNRALQELDQDGRVAEQRTKFGVERDESWPVRIVRAK